ncbi:hybrid sensor histidine kinase/response regulator [Oscillatoria sp. CS-180]|nr:hybrid sensor histidine kinase/response regulator [Oscillatoria sp. CS-180]MDB9528301.1 hybrid sensor histidine kinase/response regulator [Oscillatoria sp. CS-180]
MSDAIESGSPSFVSAIADDELRDIFRTTSEERLQQLETNLLYLEKHPQDGATLAALMREAHSLKGDSRSAGVDSVEGLAHALEDVLTSVQRQELELDPAICDRLYQGLDAMGQLVQEAVTGEPAHVNTEHLLAALRETLPPLDTQESETEPLSAPLTETATSLTRPEPPLRRTEDIAQIDTVRVQTRELDVLMAQVEELAVTRIQVAQTSAQTNQLIDLWEAWKTSENEELDPEELTYEERLENLLMSLRSTIQDNSSKLELVAEDLRDRIRKLQLIPLSMLFQPLPRVVRDLAKQQSKAVNLILEGEDNSADKRLLQGIKDALMHLVRNAIDHGIEPPKDRIAAGKPETATLRVKAHQTAISLMIEISDDGRGLDTEQIKRTAIKRRLYRPEELETMSVSQIQRLILAPGFSTRSFITEISGRGVGLDVVQTQVEKLKGSIQIDSVPGQGCTFRLQLSTALSTANVLLVKTQGISLALPIDFLQTSLLVSPEQIVTEDGQDTLVIDNQTIPVANLIDVLELRNSPIYNWVARPAPMTGDRRPCILIKVGNEQAGFFVDELVDQREVVSKALSPILKRVPNVTGATILGTGEICMILNPSDLLKSLQQQSLSETVTPPQPETTRQSVILLVEDSPTVRTQEKRLFEKAGYEVVTARNGREGYNTLKTGKFDAIVSDVEMPHLDGFSLVAKIRELPKYDDLPIILVTTLDSDEDRQRGAEAGANAYILKGRFNQEALLETLERLI